ncbi:MAG: citrate synthase family protein [Thermoleophilia bacterium]|nr:citrate synthase family protein [Thermoleophilia bacterium]
MAAEPAAPDTLSATEAATLLGVSRATLYAYVSRGLVASAPGPGPSRARRYPRVDLDAFLERRERARDRDLAAHGSLHWGLPVLDSALTLIEDGRCHLRGRDIVGLSRESGFEEVAALLWSGDMGAAVSAPVVRARGSGPSADALARHLVGASQTPLVALGAPAPVVMRGAARVVAGMFAAAGARGGGPLAVRLARGWGTPHARVIDAALVLSADHELNVSSFTARCVASADAGLEQVLLAALCALRGRRHGGLTERVEDLVAGADRDGPRRAAERALGGDGTLPGFGHPLYPDGDPRAAELLRITEALAPPGDPVQGLVALARDQLGQEPTLDLGLAAVARRLGLPAGAAFCLFALGRSAGWIAHAIEARADDRLIRPRSRYTGPRPVAVGSSPP